MNMGIRSQIQNRNRFAPENRGVGPRQFVWVVLASLGVHLLFFIGIFFFHDFDFQTPKPRVVTVDLVSFVPGPTGGGTPEPQVPEKKAAPTQSPEVNPNASPVTPEPKEPAPVPVLKPDVSLKTKPKDIKKLTADRKKKEKPKTVPKPSKPKQDPEKELKEAREALAEKVEQQTQRQINEAMDRMKASIAQKENEARSGQGTGDGTGPGRRVADPEKLYQMVIASAIRQNWVFNDILARMDKNLECRVLVKILKSGEIRDIIFETRSGNPYLDESVKRAILRSNPLPVLPMGLRSYDIGFVFSPRGLM